MPSPAAAGSSAPLRVLLVHANPFQGVTPVPPYGLERIRSAAEPTGAEIAIVDPYLTSEEPLAAAVEAAATFRPDVVGLGIRVVDDCIVVDELQPANGSALDVSWFLPEIRRLRDALGAAAPRALFVAGGAGFSGMPGECLDFLDVDHGVVGAGEEAFPRLLTRHAAGEGLDGIPGVIRRGQEEAPLAAYALAGGRAPARSPLYAPVNAFPVRTRIGCAMECAYCLTANLRRRHGDGDLEAVLDELERTLDAARARGVAKVSIFFADDELNLPGEEHTLALLSGVVERKLAPRLRWRAYFNPTPFPDELAALVAATNGQVSVTVDTAAEAVMERARKPFRRRHLDRLVERLGRHGVPADVGLIFGLPGETEETIGETVAFVRSLPANVEVVYSAGARVYPHTPLAEIARREPERLVGADDPTFLAPVAYSSPLPPRELAARIDAELGDLPNVRPVGVGYATGRTTVARAYRAVACGAEGTEWDAVLDEAERPDDYQRSPAESLLACMELAAWHHRFDLARRAARRVVRGGHPLPAGATRGRLRTASAAYLVLGKLGPAPAAAPLPFVTPPDG